METHHDISDIEFESQFKDCSMDASIFNHEAHIRLAWIHISNYGLDQAERNIASQLKKIVASVGAADKYNETLTIAAIKVVNHFMDKSTAESFQVLIEEYPRLVNNFKDLISTHYGFDIYQNDEAKKQYLEPDLLPF